MAVYHKVLTQNLQKITFNSANNSAFASVRIGSSLSQMKLWFTEESKIELVPFKCKRCTKNPNKFSRNNDMDPLEVRKLSPRLLGLA